MDGFGRLRSFGKVEEKLRGFRKGVAVGKMKRFASLGVLFVLF